ERWSLSLAQHYDFLRDNLSTYADPTNHLIGEVSALWMLATVLPGLPDADRQRRRTLDLLTSEAERQITADGVSREQAVSYHCFVLDFYLQVLVLARRLGEAVSPTLESRVCGMLGFLDRIVGPGGELPRIGDGEEGPGLPYPCPADAAARGVSLLAVGARLFGRSEWNEGASPCSDLPLWLLGREALGPELAPPAEREPPPTVLFREGGYAFFEAIAPDRTRLQL